MLIPHVFSVWTVTSASPFTLRTEIFSCRKVFERLFVITYKFWLKLRPKQNLHNFIWFLQPSIFDLCQYTNSLLKISPITLTRLRSYPRSFWNTLPQLVHLVTQILSSFWLSDLHCSTNSPSMFCTILPSIFFRLGEYSINTHISPTVPIASQRIVQSFVSDLIVILSECP